MTDGWLMDACDRALDEMETEGLLDEDHLRREIDLHRAEALAKGPHVFADSGFADICETCGLSISSGLHEGQS